MPDWIVCYSVQENEFFHQCWDCYRRKSIHGEHLEVVTLTYAQNHTDLTPCPDCQNMLSSDRGVQIHGHIVG